MKKISGIFKFIVNLLLPLYTCVRAHYILSKKVKDLDSQTPIIEYMNKYENLTVVDLELLSKESHNRMKSLEDKAKTNIPVISISVTLLLGFMAILYNYNIDSITPSFLKIVFYISSFLTIIYMLIAGWSSLYVIGVLNKRFLLSPSDYGLEDEEKKKAIAINEEKNDLFNIIRNNYIYTSYKHIIYSLVILGLVYTIMIFSVEISSPNVDIINILTKMNSNNRESFIQNEMLAQEFLESYINNEEMDKEQINEIIKLLKEYLKNTNVDSIEITR